ncbi:MAG: alpha-galactosidase [Clostridia bacterium]|nr:alpha-galactosidase [Clostridia bacterium]
MNTLPQILARYGDGKCPSALQVETVLEASGTDYLEYHGLITNVSDHTVLLERACLADVEDLPGYGLSDGPYLVYRSGRHKNDMPGVFETGVADERLRDVASVMMEAGDAMAGGGKVNRVISDHLTVIRDRGGMNLVFAFLTGRDQLFETEILLDADAKIQRVLCSVLFSVELAPGQSVRTESLRIARTRELSAEIEQFAARKAKLYGARCARHPSVICTWYYYGLSVTLEDVERNLEIIRRRHLPYDVFQVDEGWEITLGEYEPNSKFPIPMADLARKIRNAGLVPGLWSSPFVAHETASVWKRHPEWILRDQQGHPCLFPMNDTVYYVFDITRAETWDYFRELYRRFTFEWGYTYHKLDFTRAAVIFEQAAFASRRITLAHAYYQAVKAIREGMGQDAFFLMCGGLYDPIIGLVDAQRTGSDVLSMWSSNISQGGKTAPYTIRQSMMRYYMNRWWANDPDALMIRKNAGMERGLRLTLGLLSDDEVRTSVINQFAGGGIMCQTEPLDRIGDDRLMEIRHLLPVTETRVQPLDLMSPARFPGCVDVLIKKTEAHCLCLINWSDTESEYASVNLELLRLDASKRYVVCDFYSGMYVTGVKSTDTVKLGLLRPHAGTVVKVEAMENRPIIVASDGHYSMGAECTRLEIRDGRLILEKPAILPVSAHYRVLLPEKWRASGRETVEITLAPGQETAQAGLELPAPSSENASQDG